MHLTTSKINDIMLLVTEVHTQGWDLFCMVIYKLSGIKNHNISEYGIDAFEGQQLIKSVANITDNKADILKLIEMCNELQLELCHLDDIIEDYLTDFCI